MADTDHPHKTVLFGSDAYSPAEIQAHANAIRKRLFELNQELKIDFPVYALFTKADLVKGFAEYFGSFAESRRRKVWGATFQTEDRKKNLVATVPEEFDALVKRLRGSFTRVSAERVCAGPGIVAIYETLAELEGRAVSMRDDRTIWQEALEGTDPLALAALAAVRPVAVRQLDGVKEDIEFTLPAQLRRAMAAE